MKFRLDQIPTARTRVVYKCVGCRSVVRDIRECFNAAEYFARILARRMFGRRMRVEIIRSELIADEFGVCTYEVFVGVYEGMYLQALKNFIVPVICYKI